MHSNKTVSRDQSKRRELIEILKTSKFFILPLVPVFLSLMAIYSLNRLSFGLYHFEKLQEMSAIQWLTGLFLGLRFDLAATAPFILIFALIRLIETTAVRRALWWLWSFFIASFVIMNGADSVLIDFTGRRFSQSLLMLAGEGSWLSLLSYKKMAFITFCLLAIFIWGAFKGWKLTRAHNSVRPHRIRFISMLLVLVLSVIATRGGLQIKPIGLVDAKVIENDFAHQLVLNSTFTFMTSLGRKGLEKSKYFESHELKAHLNLDSKLLVSSVVSSAPSTSSSGESKASAAGASLVLSNKRVLQSRLPIFDRATPPNVVIFILESFSQEYKSADTMPFLDQLENQGAAFFPKAYANGRRSLEGIVALFAGIPALMENPFINSEYATNQFIGLGQLFKNKNYHTSFFHGAENGSMRFDRFTHAAGFTNYFGKNEFKAEWKANLAEVDDGTWGIFDEPMLNWACEKQTKFESPFASAIFTLSSHHPFKHPDTFKPQDYLAGAQNEKQNASTTWSSEQMQILNSVAYTDYAIQKYFECARTKPWFDNTIFIFVGDHTGPTLKAAPEFQDLYHIALGFYSPRFSFNEILDTNQYAQQIDLLPTLDQLLNLNLGVQNHMARSLLQPGQKSIVFYADQRWEIIGDAPGPEKRLKAFKQYFSEAMLDNRLYQ